MFENFLAAIATAFVIGFYGYWYGGGIVEITILGMAAIYFLVGFFGVLRHSHIPFAFGPNISKVLCSPVMHQFHHSAEAEHFDKNFSVVFSLWDYLAGTIYIPQRGEKPQRLGIGPEGAEFQSVWTLYAYPFLAVLRRLRNRQTVPVPRV
jgi:sterol desaturase/sphingolipid hydroxylase (fatty acid hydroxylase superfamily)